MVENLKSFEEDYVGTNSSGGGDVETIPEKMPSTNIVVYLNNAAQAWLDPEVQATGREMVGYPPFVYPSADIPMKIRQSFSQLIRSNPEEIAIVSSTAFAITMAAKNIQRLYMEQQMKGGNNGFARNKILLLQDQMCSAVYPWQDISDQTVTSGNPLSLQIVPQSNGGWTEAVLSQISINASDILVACLPPLHWSDGAIVDLEQIAPVCHANGILLVIDATQAVGIMPLNVRHLKPAMLACSIHKWLRGPSGASLVYIDKSLHEKWEPLDQHGRSRVMKHGPSWESYPNQMTPKGYSEKYVLDARKFDGGGKPNPIILPMLQKSLEQVVARINLETCQAQLRTVVEPFLTWVTSNQDKFQLPRSPHVYHLIGIRPTDDWLSIDQMLEIAQRLQNDYQVFIAVRCGIFRISPYMDTTYGKIHTNFW
jgi:kynureninase